MNPIDSAALPVKTTMKPCYLALSSDVQIGANASFGTTNRRWRILSLDNRLELYVGDLVTNADDPLVVVRDKAKALAMEHGYDPQSFILES